MGSDDLRENTRITDTQVLYPVNKQRVIHNPGAFASNSGAILYVLE